MRWYGLALVVFCAILIGAGVSSTAFAQRPLLRGHWVGKWSCKGTDGGTKLSLSGIPSKIAISQATDPKDNVPDDSFTVAIDQTFSRSVYNGYEVTDKPNQAQAILIDCH